MKSQSAVTGITGRHQLFTAGCVVACYLCLWFASGPSFGAFTPHPLPPARAEVGPVGSGQGAADTRALETGQPVERELGGDQSHVYRIAPGAGQYLRLIVKQQGIDVTLILQGPDGKQLYRMDGPAGAEGEETLPWVTKEAGAHQVIVRSFDGQAQAGRYEIRLEELRPATEQDEARSAGERALLEGRRLLSKQKAETSRQALAFYEEAAKSFRAAGDRRREAQALYAFGKAQADLGESKAALESLNRALPLWREAGDRAEEARTLDAIGTTYFQFGDFRKTLEFVRQALPIWRELKKVIEEASTLSSIGAVHRNLSEYEQALEHYDMALGLIRGSGLQTREARDVEGVVLGNICTASVRMGELQKALDACQQSLALSRQLEARGPEGIMLNRTALVLNNLGESERAIELNEESLRLLRQVGNRRQEAITLNDLGLIHNSIGNYAKAIEYHRQSLALAREVNNRGGLLITLHNVGVTYSLSGERDQALDSFTQALALAREAGDRETETRILISLGRLAQLSGDHRQALDYSQQALQLARAIKSAPHEGYALFHLAQAQRDLGNLNEALARGGEALALSEALRAKAGAAERRSAFFATVKERYDFYIDLLMELHRQRPDAGHAAAALEASERARARSLLDLLAEARADIRQGADPSLLQQERAVRQRLSDKEQARVQLLSRKHTPEQAEAAEKEIRALATQFQDVRAQLRVQSPRYALLTQPQPLNVAELQRQVLDENTLLLEYALGDKRSFLWAVTPDSVVSYQLPPRAEIEAAARRVYELLVARQPAPGLTAAQRREGATAADAQYQTQATALSRMLLGPVAAQLGGKRLLVVPDGALQYLPFAALPVPPAQGAGARGPVEDARSRTLSPSYRPLIVEHEIVSLPSASVLAVLRREMAGRRPVTGGVAVLADPVFEPDDARVKLGLAPQKSPGDAQSQPADVKGFSAAPAAALTRAVRSVRGDGDRRAGLRRLLFSRDEAEAILKVMPAASGLKALDFRASRALAVSDELSRYRIIHFATHGLLDSQHPELSGLVLSLVDEAGRPQDGFLRLHEIYNLRLNAELVVLSACQTGLGKEVRGEGLIGLTRGFMHAGAPRVLASLWQVDDAATAELMKRFYRGMTQGQLPPAAALRAAQLEMLRKRYWQSPYYWGGFVLQGEWK